MVGGMASLFYRRAEKSRDGKDVFLSCERPQRNLRCPPVVVKEVLPLPNLLSPLAME